MTDLRLAHLASLERLAGPLEHELRGALNPVGLTLELFEHSLENADPVLRTRQQVYLARLRDALALYKSQLDALFTAIRAHSGEGGRFDWRKEIDHLGMALTAFANRRRAAVRVVLPDHPVLVPGDAGPIGQAVLAAALWAIERVGIEASEATDASVAAERKATVTLALAASDSNATLSITLSTIPTKSRDDNEPDAFRVVRDAVQRYHGRFQASAGDGDMRLELELPLERKRT